MTHIAKWHLVVFKVPSVEMLMFSLKFSQFGPFFQVIRNFAQESAILTENNSKFASRAEGWITIAGNNKQAQVDTFIR